MGHVLGRLSPPPPQAVAQALNVDHLTIEWLAGDGSDRCYFRVRSPELKTSFVLMQLSGSDAEQLKQGRYDWVEISKLLKLNGVFAPSCVSILSDHAAIIIDDYGDLMLETITLQAAKNGNINSVLPYYETSLRAVTQFLGIKPGQNDVWTQRAFDKERFIWELNFFVSKYLGPVAHYEMKPLEKAEFSNDVESLSSFLADFAHYFVHRDFHSRNIMIHNDAVAVIDFQDARLGPPSYDLVSLVFDSYVPLSPETRMKLLDDGLRAIQMKVGEKASKRAADEWRPMLLQRQLKAIGSFGYLTVDKQKGDYIRNVAPALQTLLDAGVQDARWPFLSGTLLQILAKTLPDRKASKPSGFSLAQSPIGGQVQSKKV
jgi:aminoglycoside/choline kinase family phosphotransferase